MIQLFVNRSRKVLNGAIHTKTRSAPEQMEKRVLHTFAQGPIHTHTQKLWCDIQLCAGEKKKANTERTQDEDPVWDCQYGPHTHTYVSTAGHYIV